MNKQSKYMWASLMTFALAVVSAIIVTSLPEGTTSMGVSALEFVMFISSVSHLIASIILMWCWFHVMFNGS